MSAQDFFHEKAEESRHNEMIGYVMFLAGSVFFVGGILAALSLSEQLGWFLFVPFTVGVAQAFLLEVSFLVIGLFLIPVGIACGLHFSRDRSMYMRELFEAKNADLLLKDFRAEKATVKRSSKSKVK